MDLVEADLSSYSFFEKTQHIWAFLLIVGGITITVIGFFNWYFTEDSSSSDLAEIFETKKVIQQIVNKFDKGKKENSRIEKVVNDFYSYISKEGKTKEKVKQDTNKALNLRAPWRSSIDEKYIMDTINQTQWAHIQKIEPKFADNFYASAFIDVVFLLVNKEFKKWKGNVYLKKINNEWKIVSIQESTTLSVDKTTNTNKKRGEKKSSDAIGKKTKVEKIVEDYFSFISKEGKTKEQIQKDNEKAFNLRTPLRSSVTESHIRQMIERTQWTNVQKIETKFTNSNYATVFIDVVVLSQKEGFERWKGDIYLKKIHDDWKIVSMRYVLETADTDYSLVKVLIDFLKESVRSVSVRAKVFWRVYND